MRAPRHQLRTRVAGGCAAALLGAAAAVLPPATAHGAEGCPVAATATAYAWRSIPVPRFAKGPQRVMKLAVRRGAGSIELFATNGVQLLAAWDGTCHWRELLDASRVAPNRPMEITGFEAPARSASRLVVALVERADVDRPHVLTSADDGRSWQARTGDLAGATGRPVLAVSSGDPEVAYVLLEPSPVRQPGGGEGAVTPVLGPSLWRTLDGGRTWQRRDSSPPFEELQTPAGTVNPNELLDAFLPDQLVGPVAQPSPFSASGIRIAIDPHRPDVVYFAPARGLLYTRDGGTTVFGAPLVPLPPPPPIAVLQVAPAGRASELRAWDGRSTMYYTDAPDEEMAPRGRRTLWPRVTHAGAGLDRTTAATHGVTGDHVIVAASGRVYHRVPRSEHYQSLRRPSRTAVHDLVAVPDGGTAIVFARTDRTIEWTRVLPHFERIRHPRFGTPRHPPLPGLGPIRGGAGARGAARLRPARSTRHLAAGTAVTAPYELRLPRQRAVDVFFLVDISSSMYSEIEGLRRGLREIANRLVAAGVDAHFGVGAYRGYEPGPAYERVRDIGPPDAGLRRALESLVAGGASSGGKETQLAALYQLATGRGQNDADAFIPAGQQVNFRPGALRVVVHATDETFTTGPPNPTFEEAVEALNAVGARQVGLAFEGVDLTDPFNGGGGLDADPSAGLTRVASGTDALATGPVDCDSDGAPDVHAGDPLVCVLAPADSGAAATVMAPAIVRLLLSIQDVATVELRPARGDEAVSSITPATVPGIDLRDAQRLRFDVTFGCGGAAEHDVELVATARGRAIALATASVRCAAPGPVAGRLLPPLAGAVAVGTAQLPPPQPVAHGQPQPVSQAQAQSQTQPQSEPGAQAGLVAEREAQPQLTLADGRVTASGEEYAFSAIGARDPARGAVAQLGASMLFAAACGVAYRRRPAPAAARQRRRRG